MQNKNKVLILGAVIAAVVLVVIYYLAQPSGRYSASNKTPVQTAPPVSTTKLPVPENTKVPGAGETQVDKSIAIPVSVIQSAPGASTKLRTFKISAANNAFDPATVIVNVGDTVHINFTAVDKTYDITVPDYGLKQTAQKGETKILEFQALSEGKFLYYCDLCGGEKSATKGYIVISKR